MLDYLGGGLEEVVNLTPMAGLTVDDCVYIDTYRDHQFALEHIYADGETEEEDLEAFHKHIEEYWGIPREKHDEWLRSWTPDATEELTERPADLLHEAQLRHGLTMSITSQRR